VTGPERVRSLSRRGVGRVRARDERGSGTVLVTAVVLALALVASAVLVVATYVAVVHHARAAADLVALSGAAARSRGESACRAAGVAASRNGVRLTTCREQGDSLDFVVTVTVEQRVTVPSPVLPDTVGASAHAGRLGLL